MAPKPKETSGSTTTTQPPVGPAAPTTTVPISADTQALLQAISNSGLAFGLNNGTKTLGLSGVGQIDASGRLIKYTGPTKVIGGQEVRPQYFQGDEQDIATWDTETISNMQTKLAAGGYFSGSSYQPGIVRKSTIDAYQRLLEDANMSFITSEQALERSKKVPYSGTGGNGLSKYQMTSSMDLQSVFDKVSQSVVGRTLDQQELDKLVKTYQGVQVAGQKSQAGVVEQVPTAQVFAQKKIETNNQDEADAYQFTQYAQVLERMLGG
jgi:hypothetical protein